MISPTINFRVLLLAVLPTTAVSIIFFSYFVNQQIDEIEANTVDKGRALATHLASASEYGIFSGNMAILSPLVESAFSNTNIVSITVTNNQGTPLIQKNREGNDSPEAATLNESHNRVFSQPVIQHTIDINDFENSDDGMPPVIGWVVVEVSNEAAVHNKQEAILQTLLITILILVSSIFLATRISRHITEPISALTTAVNEIEEGNLDVTIETHSTGALLSLEKGVRNMLKSLKESHWEAQNTIEKATKDLRESLELLEQQNAELTFTRQQALSANQAKSSFLANISHEIRTPMNGILGFVKLLNNSNPTQEQTDYLYTIEQSANNLLGIINDVLDLSKIEAGKISIKNTKFDLEECIEDVLSLISPSAHDKNIEIASLYYDDTPKNLFGASDRVRQILINLIGNAIKFSDEGTIVVRAMLESKTENTLKIKLSITDQGPGVLEKDKKKLFDSFSQIDTSDTRQYGGAGLGLAISKSLAEAMRGNIGVDSRKDEGSTFWFTFECQAEESSSIISENDDLPYRTKKAALYDANELTKLSVTHSLRHQGFEVTECLDIEDLCALDKTTPKLDMFVLSLNKTNSESSEIKEFLGKYRDNLDTKILAIVSSSSPSSLKLLRGWGADACVSKPFRHADFEKTLSTLFNTTPSHKNPELSDSSAPDTLMRLDGLNILIAEDNAINAKLVETILHRSGAIPFIVDNGKKAVDAFINNSYDIILMDIHMPVMNGVDAAHRIRELGDPASRTAIIGLTAASKSKDEELFENADFDEVLEKPIAVDELLHEIAYWTHVKKSSSVGNRTRVKSREHLGIDKGLSTTLNEMLLQELPSVKEKLQVAYESADFRFLRGEIHRLLGGMAYCSFPDLHALTLQFQNSLKTTSTSIDDDFRNLINEISRLIETEKS